jgi:transposase-like protein
MDDCVHIPVWTAQRIERTNARGRHRYCKPFKTWIVAEALKPGMSTAGLAMRNEVNANQLRRWVMLYGKREAAPLLPRLLPVTLTPDLPQPVAASQPPQAIAIELGGAVVRIREGVDAKTLRIVLDALRQTQP